MTHFLEDEIHSSGGVAAFLQLAQKKGMLQHQKEDLKDKFVLHSILRSCLDHITVCSVYLTLLLGLDSLNLMTYLVIVFMKNIHL
jgi:hypothetical protein